MGARQSGRNADCGEMKRCVSDDIAGLRDAAVLRHIEGKTNPEIAEYLRCGSRRKPDSRQTHAGQGTCRA